MVVTVEGDDTPFISYKAHRMTFKMTVIIFCVAECLVTLLKAERLAENWGALLPGPKLNLRSNVSSLICIRPASGL